VKKEGKYLTREKRGREQMKVRKKREGSDLIRRMRRGMRSRRHRHGKIERQRYGGGRSPTQVWGVKDSRGWIDKGVWSDRGK